MTRLIVSPRAERDLKEILAYIARQSGRERAREVSRNIREKMKLYSGQPKTGHVRDELRQGLRSFVVYSYIVFYIPLTDGIDVKRVIHGSRDLDGFDYSDDDTLA